MRNTNQLKLLQLIQGGSGSTVDQLSEALGVSRRSIFRYLRTLSESGIQIFWTEERGYHFPKGVTIPAIVFDSNEIITLITALGFLGQQEYEGLSNAAANLERRILSQLPSDAALFVEAVKNAITINPNAGNVLPSKNKDLWHTLVSSILDRKQIKFSYRKARSKSETRTVVPFHLIHYVDHWTLVGYDVERNDLRSFVLDRMTNLILINAQSDAKTTFSREQILRHETRSPLIKIAVAASNIEKVLRSFPAKIVSRETIGLDVHLSFHFDNFDYLNYWLLQFGNEIRCISPSGLIDSRKKILSDLSK